MDEATQGAEALDVFFGMPAKRRRKQKRKKSYTAQNGTIFFFSKTGAGSTGTAGVDGGVAKLGHRCGH